MPSERQAVSMQLKLVPLCCFYSSSVIPTIDEKGKQTIFFTNNNIKG